MTIKQLMAILKTAPDDGAPVVLSKDSEGNMFSPLAEVSGAFYEAKNKWCGEIYDLNDKNAPKKAQPAIVLWPMN